MLFRRRHQPSLWMKASNFVWPKAGWKRALFYMKHRVGRISGTPAAIAIGLACGSAVSFTPFLGFHFVLAGMLAWILGGSIIASAIGTAVGNPWTFPFIWAASYRLGAWILGAEHASDAFSMGLKRIMEHPFESLAPVFGPLTLGGIVLGAAAWFVTYWISLKVISEYHANRTRRLKRRREQLAMGKGEGASA